MAGAEPTLVVAAPARAARPLSAGERALAADLLRLIGWPALARAAAGGRCALVEEIDRRIAAIDGLMTAQVNAVLHHPRFQRLEASWRGLAWLSAGLEGRKRLKLRILTISWAGIARDLDRSAEFDQTQLFRKIYENEFGMPGGEPFGLMVADYYVQHRPARSGTDDIAVMRGLAGVAAAAFCPMVLGAAPELFGLDSFRDLHPTLDLDRLFGQREYTRWRAMQKVEDTRFLGVLLPPVLLRRPHADMARCDRFRFEEATGAQDGGEWLWGHPGYAFASVVMRAYGESGWFADIRGTRPEDLKGGLVRDLAQADFTTDAPGLAVRAPLPVSLSDRQERALAELGFVPLAVSPYTAWAIFYTNQSLWRPEERHRGVASVNARMSSMLNYVLCVSRFAHYIKVIGRDRVGSFMTASDCQQMLQSWLHNFTMTPTGTKRDAALLAKYPLSEARVQVREVPGRPGVYTCTAHLRPHYQLDDVVSTFRLTTEIAPPHRGG